MRAQRRSAVDGDGIRHDRLMFKCPGCAEMFGDHGGWLFLPVDTSAISPSWAWNGSEDLPTLQPSILSKRSPDQVCHSFLTDGIFHFLSDCTHSLAGKSVPATNMQPYEFLGHKEGS